MVQSVIKGDEAEDRTTTQTQDPSRREGQSWRQAQASSLSGTAPAGVVRAGVALGTDIVVQTLTPPLLAGGGYYCNYIAFIITFPRQQTAASILPSLS